jgi:hypothetical protein
VFSHFKACDQVETATQVQRGGQVMIDEAAGGDAQLIARHIIAVHTNRVDAAVPMTDLWNCYVQGAWATSKTLFLAHRVGVLEIKGPV